MNYAKPITDEQWEGLAGAEGWGADRPLVREEAAWFGVVSRDGISVWLKEQDYYFEWAVAIGCPNQGFARRLLEGLDQHLDVATVKSLGFEPTEYDGV